MNKSFDERVLEIVKKIPYGRVTTYGAIASYLSSKKSARLVGWVLNRQRGNYEIPAHRVVNRIGLLTGKHYFEGTDLMQQLLESEGVEIKNDRVQNLDKYFWQPK